MQVNTTLNRAFCKCMIEDNIVFSSNQLQNSCRLLSGIRGIIQASAKRRKVQKVWENVYAYDRFAPDEDSKIIRIVESIETCRNSIIIKYQHDQN